MGLPPPQLFTTSPFQSLTRSPHGDFDEAVEGRVWLGSFVKVSKKSHAYLRSVFWDRRPDSFVTDVSRQYTPRDAAAAQQVGASKARCWRWVLAPSQQQQPEEVASVAPLNGLVYATPFTSGAAGRPFSQAARPR